MSQGLALDPLAGWILQQGLAGSASAITVSWTSVVSAMSVETSAPTRASSSDALSSK